MNLYNYLAFLSTLDLRESCSVEMSINEKIGKFRGLAFIACPEHVSNELIKLNGIHFFDTSITFKEGLTKELQIQKKKDRNKSCAKFHKIKMYLSRPILFLEIDHVPKHCVQ